ncbi:hypothetical protein QCA50_002246 [Cerrena zonata]|uniref:Uncharacterized protein n=1 Tax=Cerrena zonata TaxID=2478898 RepID=A0AAW0GSY1_9APHY
MKILVLVLAFLATQCFTSPVLQHRDLNDIFQTLETAHATVGEHKTDQPGATHASATQTASATHTTSGELGLLGHLTSGSGQIAAAKETSSHGSGSKSLSTNTATYSVIGTIPPLPSHTPWSMLPSSVSTATQATTSSTPSAPASSPKQSSTSREWKIIGVAVIAFSTVAAILLLAVFFDSWTRFVKDFFFRRKRGEGSEELVPDWEKASWDVRLGQDRHRYPSFASLPSETLMQGLGFVSPHENGNPNPQGPLGRSTSTRRHPREKETELPTIYPLNPQPYRPPAMNEIADQYTSPQIPTATRNHTRSRSHRSRNQRQADNPFNDPPKSPGMTSIYGGIAS